ncbi:MAG: diguanylate cyclase [Desulfobacteraceae bacterium]|jgi:diguanylate cyclase
MSDEKYTQKIYEIVRITLPLMSKHNIPVTPRNYTVWYTHVSGECPELSENINKMIDRAEIFDEEINENLYQKFCIEKREDELRKFRQGLQKILDTILREIMELTGQTEQYNSSISQTVSKLSEGVSAENLTDIINEIIEETKAMGAHGKTMQQNLRETTENLKTIQKEFEEAKSAALIDYLTGVPNRKALDDKYIEYASEAVPGDKDLCLLLIDIDHFKKFNDKYGHLIGDDVLKFVARKIREIIRGRDFFARYGGEEFAVLLSNTPISGAEIVAENIRKFFAESAIKTVQQSFKLGNITVSIGIACYRSGESFEELFFRSDRALYWAKNNGRNRVVCE